MLDAMQSSKRPKSALILSCCVSEDISCKESSNLPVSEKLSKSGSDRILKTYYNQQIPGWLSCNSHNPLALNCKTCNNQQLTGWLTCNSANPHVLNLTKFSNEMNT